MNKRQCKALALAAPLCLSLMLTTPKALALEGNTADIAVVYLEPRFEYLSRISSGLTISSAGRAACGGSFTTYDQYDSRMTMTLQQFSDSGWVDIKEWSQDFTGSGVKMMDKGYYVKSGYRYRMTVMVEILDSDGSVLETEFCDSPIKEY